MSEDRSTLVAGWRLDSGEVIDLLQPAQLHRLPAGTVVTSIFGETKTVGRDKIDEDTRAGFTAFGLPCPRATRRFTPMTDRAPDAPRDVPAEGPATGAAKCQCCGQAVLVISADEGTQAYVGAEYDLGFRDGMQQARQAALDDVRREVENLSAYSYGKGVLLAILDRLSGSRQ